MWIVPLTLATLFAFFAIRFAFYAPPFEGNGEPSHFIRVASEVGRSYPSLVDDPCRRWDDDAAREPPLYYWLGVAAAATMPEDTDAAVVEPNALANLGDPDARRDRNAVIHSPSDPRASSASLFLLRLLGVVYGATTVFLTHRLVRLWFPRNRAVGIGAAALLALNPQFQFVSATASPVALGSLLLACSCLVAVQVIVAETLTRHRAVLLGALAGLCVLGSGHGWMGLGMAVAAWVYVCIANRRRRGSGIIGAVVLSLATCLAVMGWWLPRRLGWEFLAHLLTRIRVWGHLSPGEATTMVRHAALSYWGLFGWHNVPAPESYHVTVQALTLGCIAGVILRGARRYWRGGDVGLTAAPSRWVLFLWLALGTASAVAKGPPLWLDGFAAAVPVAALLADGLLAWVPWRFRYGPLVLVAVALIGASWVAPTQWLLPAYTPPQALTIESVPEAVNDVHVTFAEGPYLLGYTFDDGSLVADRRDLTLYWLATRRMRVNVGTHITAISPDGDVLYDVRSHPGGGNRLTEKWLPGDVVVDQYELPAVAKGPMVALINVGAFLGCHDDTSYLPASDAHGHYVGEQPQIARVRLDSGPQMAPQLQKGADAVFGDAISLTAYELSSPVVTPDQPLDVSLNWQVLAEQVRDYTVFLHLIDSQGDVVTQVDEEPLAGRLPTSFWRRGETVADRHQLPIPQSLAPGTYELRLGLYWLRTGERLSVTRKSILPDAAPAQSYLVLDTVQVGP